MLAVLRLLAEAGDRASWIMYFIAAIVAVFTVYLGIAMWTTLHARDDEQRKAGYKVFRDLLKIFGRGRWQ